MIQINQAPPREMTEAEYAVFVEFTQAEPPAPTPEEQLAALKEALLERDVLIAEMALQLQNR